MNFLSGRHWSREARQALRGVAGREHNYFLRGFLMSTSAPLLPRASNIEAADLSRSAFILSTLSSQQPLSDLLRTKAAVLSRAPQDAKALLELRLLVALAVARSRSPD